MTNVDVIKRLEQIELSMSDLNKPMNTTETLIELGKLATDMWLSAAEEEKQLKVNQCKKVATLYEVRVKEEYCEVTFVIEDDEDEDEEYHCVETKDATYHGHPVNHVEEETLDVMWDNACRLVNESKYPM